MNVTKIASAYGKDTNPQKLINSSTIRYIDPNKNRTDSWLTANGLQFPRPSSSVNSVDNTIPHKAQSVNTSIPDKSGDDIRTLSMSGDLSGETNESVAPRREIARLKRTVQKQTDEIKRLKNEWTVIKPPNVNRKDTLRKNTKLTERMGD